MGQLHNAYHAQADPAQIQSSQCMTIIQRGFLDYARSDRIALISHIPSALDRYSETLTVIQHYNFLNLSFFTNEHQRFNMVLTNNQSLTLPPSP